ncbi:MAG: lipid-A-disaccharide synthase, partial [Planctomycetes bacterium]|nr:lipid-A-disaccharide synthase [Planctomycetota bacterium]
MPRVFISTAETSADRHASHLARALTELVPDLHLSAAGGDMLADAGAEMVVNMIGRSVMGFWEVLSQLSFYRKAAETIIQ